MANANSPFGLRPVCYASGAPYNGPGNMYYIASATAQALYVGDPVYPTGTSDAFGIPGITIGTAAGGAYILGSFGGIATGGPAGSVPIGVTRDLAVYHPSSLSQYVIVHDDPNLLFAVQEDSLGGSMGADAPSANVDLIAGAGSTVTGYSGWTLDSSTLNTTATLQMRILRVLDEPDNLVGTAYVKWLCRINLHALTRTLGV